MQNFKNKALIKKSFIWLQIPLSYMFLTTVVATMVCVFLQQPNKIIIFVGLFIGAVFGIFKAENIRKNAGLIKHHSQLKEDHQHF